MTFTLEYDHDSPIITLLDPSGQDYDIEVSQTTDSYWIRQQDPHDESRVDLVIMKKTMLDDLYHALEKIRRNKNANKL
jgi:hypothetical protein|tara:strand:+ start:75 stop:308 length:234 start_codon:yes stop_codon:yes gene_type:complete